MSLKTFAAFAVAAAAFASAPAFAAVDDDVETCRAAFAAQQGVDAEDYRAKFEKSRGSRVRTLTLAFVPTGEGETVKAVCKVQGGEVVELTLEA